MPKKPSKTKQLDLIFNSIGLVGVAIILTCYFLLNAGTLKSDSITYLLTNILGASLVLVSLIRAWNLPSFIIEVAWILISLYGLFKALS